MFKKILVPTDGSPFSEDAACRAVSLAKEAAGQIIAFYVDQPYEPFPSPGSGNGFAIQPHFKKAKDRESQRILGFVENLCWREGVNCRKVTKDSNVIYQAIIDAATDNDCDLICMASHGRGGSRAIVLGSETSKVLTHSKIPVLVCR
jgi:nucleotide-binding universal stress UspA family protein